MSPVVLRAARTLHSRKQDFVRSAIWDAAVDLFAKTGFEETTVEEIARAAGVSTRSFFRYFASKNDLMGHGMVAYRTLLVEAIRAAPAALPPVELVRHTVRRVAADAGSSPRLRQIVQISRSSVAAREAQLSRRGELENVVAQAYAARCRIPASDEATPRLLLGLTLTILDVAFRVWANHPSADIVTTTEEVFDRMRTLVAGEAPRRSKRSR